MAETFCCLPCRLLQDRADTCRECGSPVMVLLASAVDALKVRGLEVTGAPQSGRGRAVQVAATGGFLAGYAGIIAASVFWIPGVPIILGVGAGVAGLLGWRYRSMPIAEVDRHAPELAEDAVTRTGVAHKLAETTKSVVDGSPVFVEEATVVREHRGVLLRRISSVPFLLESDGERIAVTGVVRVTSAVQTCKLGKSDPIVAALGVPPEIALAGELETATIREGDHITVTGPLGVEVIQELAFHRDAGETRVIRGAVHTVATIACDNRP